MVEDEREQDMGDTDPVDPTLLEELDYEAIKKALWRYEHALDRRAKRRANELSAVEAKQVVTVEHSSALQSLQSKAEYLQCLHEL